MDRGPGCYAKVSSNLLRLARFPLASSHRHFCANLLNLSKFRCRVKLRFCGNQACNCFIFGRQVFLPIRSTWTADGSLPQKVALRKNFKQQPATNRLAHFARTKGISSRVMQWVCSLRDSLQGLDELTLPIRPTNRLPTSPLGAGPKATGRLHCYICNFSRVAQATLQCKSRIALLLALFRDFLRIATDRQFRNPKGCGKASVSVETRPENGADPSFIQQNAEIRDPCKRSK